MDVCAVGYCPPPPQYAGSALCVMAVKTLILRLWDSNEVNIIWSLRSSVLNHFGHTGQN